MEHRERPAGQHHCRRPVTGAGFKVDLCLEIDNIFMTFGKIIISFIFVYPKIKIFSLVRVSL
jgi:hypothetical protein